MATLATVSQVALISVLAPLTAPAFGTGMQSSGLADLHGQEFGVVRTSILETRRRNQELSEAILAVEPTDELSYNPVPPRRSYFVDVVFERGGRIPPMPFDLDEELPIG